MLEVFGFGPQFLTWIKILYSGGKSCIKNNGYISDFFNIERSARQGDPISPLIFILSLEPLLHCIRKDKNILGIKIQNNEIKLTGYADDVSYFCRDKKSGVEILKKIELFSKISGLQINKTKSECMILSNETQLDGDSFEGIPIVDLVKILGQCFGKNSMIRNFHNFYSKLAKIDKIFNIWRQRDLTLFGKTLIIKSLINSQFLFNSQVEMPPDDFLKEVNKKCKDFLWNGGTPKIAHKSIINPLFEGGLAFPDLECFLEAQSLKALKGINFQKPSNRHACLVNWLKPFFGFTNHGSLFTIFDCRFNVPPRKK